MTRAATNLRVLPRLLAIQTMDDHPTASWDAMQDGNVFYRREQIYSIPNKLPRLDDFVVAGCKHGGPLGMVCSRVSVQVQFDQLTYLTAYSVDEGHE